MLLVFMLRLSENGERFFSVLQHAIKCNVSAQVDGGEA